MGQIRHVATIKWGYKATVPNRSSERKEKNQQTKITRKIHMTKGAKEPILHGLNQSPFPSLNDQIKLLLESG
jgi:hypothetical protein